MKGIRREFGGATLSENVRRKRREHERMASLSETFVTLTGGDDDVAVSKPCGYLPNETNEQTKERITYTVARIMNDHQTNQSR